MGFWRKVRNRTKVRRKLRRDALKSKMPILKALCNRTGITCVKVEHGYQFRRDEYVINWSPSTNKVSISYTLPGQSHTVPFTKNGLPGKPRILIALEELIELVRTERRPDRPELKLPCTRAG